jgi:hypothetical protein
VHAGGVQAALAWHVPEGVLEHGYQHDTAEAFEVRSSFHLICNAAIVAPNVVDC